MRDWNSGCNREKLGHRESISSQRHQGLEVAAGSRTTGEVNNKKEKTADYGRRATGCNYSWLRWGARTKVMVNRDGLGGKLRQNIYL